MYYEKWQLLDPSGAQFIRYDQLSDFVDQLEPPLRIPKPNHLLLVAMDLPICEDDRMHCVDILDGLTKYFLGTLDISALSAGADVGIDIKKDRPKDYHPISTTVQRQRENYLGRLGLRHFRSYVQQRRLIRQCQEPILERITMDELIAGIDNFLSKSKITNQRTTTTRKNFVRDIITLFIWWEISMLIDLSIFIVTCRIGLFVINAKNEVSASAH